jgi:thioredoxin 1
MALNISESTFKNFIENSLSLLYIRADWCGPCKQLSPIIDEVSSELGNKVVVGKMDADANLDFVKTLNVRNIPTILYYKNGEVVERTNGLKTKNEILSIVNKLLEN